jgi:hypothetical protein
MLCYTALSILVFDGLDEPSKHPLRHSTDSATAKEKKEGLEDFDFIKYNCCEIIPLFLE